MPVFIGRALPRLGFIRGVGKVLCYFPACINPNEWILLKEGTKEKVNQVGTVTEKPENLNTWLLRQSQTHPRLGQKPG